MRCFLKAANRQMTSVFAHSPFSSVTTFNGGVVETVMSLTPVTHEVPN